MYKLDSSYYRRIQIEANYRKFNTHSPDSFNFTRIAQDLCKRHSPPAPPEEALNLPWRKGTFKICCMGARNGAELIALGLHLDGKNFVKSLANEETKLTIIGTDISPTSRDIQNMYEHDFHEVLPSSLGPVDVIYLNSRPIE